MNRLFDHEKLEVYRASLSFIEWLEALLQKLPESLAVTDQLDRASPSIPLNIAEGKGKFTGAGRCRFFDHARGSALECAVALDVLVAKTRCSTEEVSAGKDRHTLEYRFHAGRVDQGQLRLPGARRQLGIGIRITIKITITRNS